jgi:hypothetical protein
MDALEVLEQLDETASRFRELFIVRGRRWD